MSAAEKENLAAVEEGVAKIEEDRKAKNRRDEFYAKLPQLAQENKEAVPWSIFCLVTGLLTAAVGFYYMDTLDDHHVKAYHLTLSVFAYGLIAASVALLMLIQAAIYTANEELFNRIHIRFLFPMLFVSFVLFLAVIIGIILTIRVALEVEFNRRVEPNFCPTILFITASVAFIVCWLLPAIWVCVRPRSGKKKTATEAKKTSGEE